MAQTNESVAINIPRQNNLIFTFMFFLHGGIVNLELSQEDYKIFKNCRLFSETTNFGRTCSNPDIDYMKQTLQKNIKGSTYDIFVKRARETESGIKPLVTITYDKMFGVNDESEINGWFDGYGIYLLSVHERIEGINVYKDISNGSNQLLNLLKIKDLEKFASVFGNEIGSRLRIGTQIVLSSEGDFIFKIKMSKFIELIKSIVGENNYFNLLDFSCSVNKTDQPVRFYNTQIADIENMSGEELWGGKKNKTQKIKNKKNKKNKSKTKGNMKNKGRGKIRTKKYYVLN